VPGKVHGLTSSDVQRRVADATAAWLTGLVPTARS
jgi:hypothetical protein